jgi:DNA mismatch endonuclease (patch repair protein)
MGTCCRSASCFVGRAAEAAPNGQKEVGSIDPASSWTSLLQLCSPCRFRVFSVLELRLGLPPERARIDLVPRGKCQHPMWRRIAPRRRTKFRYQRAVDQKPHQSARFGNPPIFVHGCFWHRHSCVYGQATPKTNTRFWKEKFERNMMRDRESKRALHALGWSFTTIWECQLRHPGKVRARLARAIRQMAPI